MSFKNQSLESEFQLNLDLTAEELNQDTDYTDHTDESDELIDLLAEILEVEFGHKPEDSIEVLEGNAIYCLDDEKTIEARERFEQQQLDEGSAPLDKLDELEEQAQDYFSHPKYYPIDENDAEEEWVTAYFQQFKGASFDSNGKLKECWRSVGAKLVINFNDLFNPEEIMSLAEANDMILSDVLRLVVYSPSLDSLVGSKIYRSKEAKEYVPLVEGDERILLAVPSLDDTDDEESIYDWIHREIQDGIPYGIQPNVSRSTIGHWEMTQARLEEIQEEEMERKNLLQFSKRETFFAKKQSEFNDRYGEAKRFILGVNSGAEPIKALYSMKPSVLEDVLYLAEKCGERINNTAVYLQVKSLASKNKLQALKGTDSQALSIITAINKGELVEIHLLSLTVLEEIFSILWSSIGIRIIPEKKEVYFQLKEIFASLRSRSAKSGKSA